MLRQCLGQQARRALRPGGAADKSWAAATSALSSSAADGPALCVLDPLLLLEPLRLQARDQERGAGGSKPYVSLEVSTSLLAAVARGGQLQLGDMDDPQNHWAFGDEAAEFFQYKFSGSHTVVSGWTCVVDAEVVAAALEVQTQPAGASWAAFQALTTGKDRLLREQAEAGGLPIPLLFAGRLLDCPSASVFRLAQQGQRAHGLLVSNDFESVDD
mmetsp:Transcript_1027/g.2380  ORF Transcript_1027/g.2380 Transcript_1027/m.2380 type:complete len:215 (-) Transcript_1027:394-1038(-)|eukprot:jgi/Tetstr1/458645/TSEL_045038.t1